MSEFDMKLLIEELQERNDNLNKENNELSLKNQRLYNVLDKIKEILKDYGNKEDISEITMYYISGESLIHILEILEEIE
jgi:regulator of replication initiation timing